MARVFSLELKQMNHEGSAKTSVISSQLAPFVKITFPAISCQDGFSYLFFNC
jgi:hypothetical protein